MDGKMGKVIAIIGLIASLITIMQFFLELTSIVWTIIIPIVGLIIVIIIKREKRTSKKDKSFLVFLKRRKIAILALLLIVMAIVSTIFFVRQNITPDSQSTPTMQPYQEPTLTPEPTPTSTLMPTPTATPTLTPTPMSTPMPTPTLQPTATPISTPTQTPQPTPTIAPTPQPVWGAFSGSLTQNGQTNEYTFDAPATGIFHFEFISDTSNVDYQFIISDERGNPLRSSWLSAQGISITLNENQKYLIRVIQSNGFMGYTINIRESKIEEVIDNQIISFLELREQVEIFSFVAPTSGIYNFQFASNVQNVDYQFIILDERGNQLRSSWLSTQGFSIDLNENQKYLFQVMQTNGFMEYTISIHEPQMWDVDGNQIISFLERREQVDVYRYTAPATGIYNFQFISDVQHVDYQFIIFDERGNQLRSSWLSTQGFSISLNEGQEYLIHVRQQNGYTRYTINIREPRIYEYIGNQIINTLDLREQVDIYTYVAPATGIYHFQFVSDVPNVDYQFIIFDERGNQLRSSWLSSHGISLVLNEKQKYLIHVIQQNGFTGYTINISEPAFEVVGSNQFIGSLELREQVNVYTYVAPTSGMYRFQFVSDVPNVDYQFILFDEEGNLLNTSWLSSRELSLTLQAGQNYIFHVVQQTGFMRYTITINAP